MSTRHRSARVSGRPRARARKSLAWLWPGLAGMLACGGYVAFARLGGLSGFPLDDAWIHQTYARSLALTGQLAYLPGQPSAGSTSPAWSFLLSVAYMVGLDPLLWATLLGGLALAATAWLVYRLALRLAPARTAAALLAGLFCAVEWHLVWASASGMETVLFTTLSLGLMEAGYGYTLARDDVEGGPASLRTEQVIVRAVGIGLLAGALALTRPEGLALDGLILIGMIVPGRGRPVRGGEWRLRLIAAGIAGGVLAALLVPYVAFNLRSSGWLFPNTFYAKQAEYRAALPLAARLWRVLSPTLVGAQVLLLPGFVHGAYRLIRGRDWAAVVPVVWWLALIVLYAVRLPVDYQHGRYTMPSIPILILVGAYGTAELLRPRSPRAWLRVLGRAAPVALGVLAVVFLARGALAYRDDTGFIEGEMVATARWIKDHTAPGDLIAVHDIGAIGYLVDRPLLDLAGLISPEVVPFIADPDRLASWMVERGARYAVLFPDFSPAYARLATDPRLEEVYCSGYEWTRAAGRANLCVYRVTGY